MAAFKIVDAATLQDWLDKGEATLVDVREPSEHQAENIRGATLIPLGEISADKLPDYSGKKLVMQCRSGGRSGKACEKLISEISGLEIYNLQGGILAWKDSGHETVSGGAESKSFCTTKTA
jgi:rhodanese-related sulfurtransferase